MKFLVNCADVKNDALQKSLKYDVTKGHTLEQHVANIHRSLELMGLELPRGADAYTLQVVDRKGDAVRLEDGSVFRFQPGVVDAYLQTIADHAKRQRMRDLAILLVPTPSVRADEVIAGLSSADSIKETAYSLRSYIEDDRFLEAFVDKEGLSKLVAAIPSCKGNTLAYTIAALHTTISASARALSELVSKHGEAIGMIYALLASQGQVLSAARLVVDVLRLACTVEGGFEAVHSVGKGDQAGVFAPIVCILMSEDLHSRLSGMRFITTVLEQAPAEEKSVVVEALVAQSVVQAMEESLWIKHTDIRAELNRFESVSGLLLDRTSTLCIPEGTEEELKEKIRELAVQLMAVKQELLDTKQSGEAGEGGVEASKKSSAASASEKEEDAAPARSPEPESAANTAVSGSDATAVEAKRSEELSRLKEEAARLEEELAAANRTIAEQQEKINDLKRTTGMLVSDAALDDSERQALLASLTSKKTAAGDKEETQDAESVNTDEQQAKEEKSNITGELEVLRKELSDCTIETYQSKLKVTQVNQELEQLNAQKQKVQQVVSTLEQRNVALRENLAEAEAKVVEAKGIVKKLKRRAEKEQTKIKQLKAETAEKHATLRGKNDLPYSEMQKKVATMEQLVMVTSREKKEFQKEIAELKEKLAGLDSAGQ